MAVLKGKKKQPIHQKKAPATRSVAHEDTQPPQEQEADQAAEQEEAPQEEEEEEEEEPQPVAEPIVEPAEVEQEEVQEQEEVAPPADVEEDAAPAPDVVVPAAEEQEEAAPEDTEASEEAAPVDIAEAPPIPKKPAREKIAFVERAVKKQQQQQQDPPRREPEEEEREQERVVPQKPQKPKEDVLAPPPKRDHRNSGAHMQRRQEKLQEARLTAQAKAKEGNDNYLAPKKMNVKHKFKEAAIELEQQTEKWARSHVMCAVFIVGFAVLILFLYLRRVSKRRASKRRAAHHKRDFNRWDPRANESTNSWASSVLPPTVKASAQRGDLDAVLQWLSSSVGNVEARDADQRTVAHHAVAHGHSELARALFEHGASPDAPDADGSSALHVAARVGSAACARVLLDAGADVSLGDNSGRTPRAVAESHGNHGCARLIVRRERAVAKSSATSNTSGNLQYRRGTAALEDAA